MKKRKHFKLRADHNFGFMGRSPDFMNQFVTGWHLMADRFARAGARFGENATRYYEYVRERDLFLTHMLINPQIDRSQDLGPAGGPLPPPGPGARDAATASSCAGPRCWAPWRRSPRRSR